MCRPACLIAPRDPLAPSCGVGFRAAPYGVRGAAHPELRRTLRGGIVGKRFSVCTLLLSALVGVTAASAQQRQITGRVTSATGEPVAGVALSQTGTAFAAVTNADGRYAIAAPAATVTLVFRRIAFKRKEVAVAPDQNTADVSLEPDVFNLGSGARGPRPRRDHQPELRRAGWRDPDQDPRQQHGDRLARPLVRGGRRDLQRRFAADGPLHRHPQFL